jgi:hypothetical protein
VHTLVALLGPVGNKGCRAFVDTCERGLRDLSRGVINQRRDALDSTMGEQGSHGDIGARLLSDLVSEFPQK